MKIGLFTDCHYNHAEEIGGGRRPAASYEKIKEAMEHFRREGVEVCFCLGDMTDHTPSDTKKDIEKCYREAMELITSFNIPFYLVPGNHDYLVLSADEMRRMCGFKIPPYTVICDECDIIVLDANYRSNMVRFDKAGVVWTDANLPPDQLEYLERALRCTYRDCIVMVHENLDNTLDRSHVIKNADAARKIIKRSGKVKAVIQGHYHGGAHTVIDGIPYITLPAMCESESDYYRVIDV